MAGKNLNRKTVTKAELSATLYKSSGCLSHAQARDLCQSIFEEITQALARGEPVRLNSFGRFSVLMKRERIGRNPRTGIETLIKARRVVTFRPSPVFIKQVTAQIADEHICTE